MVEDEAGLRHALSRMFTHEGYEVLAAKDGKEALEMVERALPDLIITDVVMPKLDGIGMVRELRANLWGCAVPVILYTNYPCPLLKQVQEKLAITVCLPKADTSLDDLLMHVKTLTESVSKLEELTDAVTSKLNVHKVRS